MKKLLRKVFIFLVPILSLSIAYEIIIRHIDNDYSYKNHWLSLNSSKVEILSIGSSHCYCDIDPYYFSLNTFNAGHSSQTIEYDFLIFKKFYEMMDSLKYLIVTISYGDPFFSIEDNVNANALIKNYTIYYNLSAKEFKHHFEILNGIDVKAIWDFFSKKMSLKLCSEYGAFAYPVESADNWQNTAPARAKQFTFDDFSGLLHQKLVEKYNTNNDYMEQLISLCHARNIHVILLTTPIHKLFRDNINKEEWHMTVDFCNNLTQEFDNVSYVNMFEDPRFIDEDFIDSDHLNTRGAAKLSSILNSYIIDLECAHKR